MNWYSAIPKAIASAGVLFFDESEQVMLLRTTYKEHWEIPGGVIEVLLGETPVQAARREVAEELGLDVKVGPLLTIDAVPPEDDRPPQFAFVFDGGVLSPEQLSEIQFVDKEIAENRFCGPDQIRELLAPRGARRVLASIDARRGSGPLPAYLHHGVLSEA